jgi:hypothetical protein
MECVAVRRVPVKRILRSVVRRGLQLIGLVVAGVVVAIVVGASVEYGDSPWLPSSRWLALIPYTVLVFGASIREFRLSWNRVSFWLCVAALVISHVGIYAVILIKAAEWRLIWFAPLSIAEVPLIVFILYSLGYNDIAPPRNRHLSIV